MKKTYRAIRHDIVRKRQNSNCNSCHHPDEKINQIINVMSEFSENKNHKILELFAGQGNLTKIYEKFGNVTSLDRKYLKTGDSFLVFHNLIYQKKKYSIIDIDSYGFPNRMFPDIFLLIEDGILFITMPKPYVNILNGITRTHLISYYGTHNPDLNTILNQFAMWGLCHWRKVEVIDYIDCKSIWRIAMRVQKVKATEYTGVRNR